mgnify:CR=1 FL=1
MIMLEALVFGGVALGMLLCYVLGPSVCGDGEDITGTWASDSSPLLSLASQPALVPRRPDPTPQGSHCKHKLY